MIEQTSVRFMKDLKKNNNKEWFDANRPRYENARADFEKLASDILKRLSKTDESIAHLQPKECLFRINRDVRFSKNKSPYKTNMALYISKHGKKGIFPGYYFHFEPGASFIAGGIWMPMPPELKKIRQEIDYNWEEFKKLISAKKFKTVFGDLERSSETTLVHPPRGYDENNPAVAYLKFKSLIASAKITDADMHSKDLAKKITGHFEILKPLIDFFVLALEE